MAERLEHHRRVLEITAHRQVHDRAGTGRVAQPRSDRGVQPRRGRPRQRAGQVLDREKREEADAPPRGARPRGELARPDRGERRQRERHQHAEPRRRPDRLEAEHPGVQRGVERAQAVRSEREHGAGHQRGHGRRGQRSTAPPSRDDEAVDGEGHDDHAREQLVLGAAIRAQPAGAAVDDVGVRRADVARRRRGVARRFEQVAGEALAPLHLEVRPDERRHQHGADDRRDDDAERHRDRPSPAGRDDQRDEAHRRADRADDAVVERRRRLERAGRAQRQRRPPRRTRHQAMQRQRDERHRVGGLQLDVPEVRDVVRPEPPDGAGDERAPPRAGHLAREQVHGQRRGQQRQHHHRVVGEDRAVRDRVERPHQRRDDDEVIRIGQRLPGRVEDRRVEDPAGDRVGRRSAQRVEIPAEDPEIEVGIAGAVQRGELPERIAGQRPGEGHRQQRVPGERQQRAQPRHACATNPQAGRARARAGCRRAWGWPCLWPPSSPGR